MGNNSISSHFSSLILFFCSSFFNSNQDNKTEYDDFKFCYILRDWINQSNPTQSNTIQPKFNQRIELDDCHNQPPSKCWDHPHTCLWDNWIDLVLTLVYHHHQEFATIDNPCVDHKYKQHAVLHKTHSQIHSNTTRPTLHLNIGDVLITISTPNG